MGLLDAYIMYVVRYSGTGTVHTCRSSVSSHTVVVCRRRSSVVCLLFPVSRCFVSMLQVARPPTGIFFNGRNNRIGFSHFIFHSDTCYSWY